MLWQRFGRGARDKSIQATALLLVEPKDFDTVDSPEGRKRKAPEKESINKQKPKRVKKEKPAPMVLGLDKSEEDEFWEARKEVYHEPICDEKKNSELHPVLDDVINAKGRGIRCRRTPFKVYFDNQECPGSSIPLSCFTFTNVLQEFPSATTPLMGSVLVVRHGSLVFAVISAIRTSSKMHFLCLIWGQKHNHAGQR